ncbi:unnamed protein product [Meganyctiphanes norvegica]|uniref:MD-2-related lipid-recognition domain-containing protein n=1 Tax=Meganyctiphanes norvegica TaxID=48144 RepID=A0AAV2PQ22_MEGNR
MKIQFGNKGEVPWDLLVESLAGQEQQFQDDQDKTCLKKAKAAFSCGSWLSVVFVVAVIVAAQTWVLYYLMLKWGNLHMPGGQVTYYNQEGKLTNVKFSWSNCGSPDDPAQLKTLRVSPDPVPIDGNITATLNAYLDLDVDAPIKGEVSVERRLGWVWMKIPCIAGLGSCTYHDVCKLSPFPPDQPCPDPLPKYGLPCNCPFVKGRYQARNMTFFIPNPYSIIPSWLEAGDYYATAKAWKNGKQLGCYNVYVSLTTAN